VDYHSRPTPHAGNLPKQTLVAISQAEAARTNTVFLVHHFLPSCSLLNELGEIGFGLMDSEYAHGPLLS
jgi:hypothetical protein